LQHLCTVASVPLFLWIIPSIITHHLLPSHQRLILDFASIKTLPLTLLRGLTPRYVRHLNSSCSVASSRLHDPYYLTICFASRARYPPPLFDRVESSEMMANRDTPES
jgi:hypothetical protein